LAIAPTDQPSAAEDAATTSKKSRRRNTSHLKLVPEPRSQREQLRARVVQVAARLDKIHPLGKDEMERVCRQLLAEQGLPEGFLGWTMVVLASEFWRDQVAAVPPSRRLFLLPHCLKHAEGCPADYDEFGLECKKCGACSIADFRTEAEALGYKVLVAEGSPIVLKIIVSGYVDAIVGVACLNVLEKAIDKILLAGIPCMAVPLLSSDCRNTSVDEAWVTEMIRLQLQAPVVQTRTYVHLMRAAAGMFVPEELDRLAPPLRRVKPESTGHAGGTGHTGVNGDAASGPLSANGDRLSGRNPLALNPLAATEAIAYDFLAKGGKHSRPFITLAVYDALTGSRAAQAGGAEFLAGLPLGVKRAALSIETFHKASLVHDDIEDDDQFRYGEPTTHRRFGVPTAINIGDYLIGLGYRLVSRESAELGPDVVADILDRLADAHMKLCEGQGAELLWRDGGDKRLTALDALKIYALKTAPAFEAALYAGARLAGLADTLVEPLSQFARHLGIAFQILNDLQDWRQDDHNKLVAGGDVLGGRPTVLWALALESLTGDDRSRLEALVATPAVDAGTVQRVRQLYTQAGAFEKAERLVEKYRQRAEAVADAVEIDDLRALLYYLIDTVLERQAPEPLAVVTNPSLPAALPIVALP
jgi:geranylgeranyl pyrophosphate synthase